MAMIGRRRLKFPAEALRSIQLWVTIAVSVLAPLFFGSVDLFWVAIWTILLSISVLCGAAGSMEMEAAQSRVLLIFLALCCLYAFVAVAQVLPAIEGIGDPSWQRANDLLRLNVPPRISSRAEIPLASIGHFLLLVTSFMSGFFIGTSRRSSDILIRFVRYSILLYAIYGLAALIITPNLLLWVPKLAYRGSLTATFVNHNTAATFVGAGAILWFCFAYSSLLSLRFSSLRLLLLAQSQEKLAVRVITRSAGALVCFFALLLTGSRGGLICSCLGLLLAIVLMTANGRKQRFWRVVVAGVIALLIVVALLLRTGRIGSQGLFDEARWSVYGFCLEAIRQRPILGAGVGTFADLFPSLRADDFYSWGVWESAHSTILEIAVEAGLPIAAAIVIAAVASLLILGRAVIRSEGRSRRSLAAITGIALLSYLHSTIDFSLQIPGYLVLFGVLLGCGLALALSTSREPDASLGRQPSGSGTLGSGANY